MPDSDNAASAAGEPCGTVMVNGQAVAFGGGTISDLLASLEITSRAIAVELNASIVASDRHGDTEVSDGDVLEIVTLVGGG